jgi:citrate lyase subunit beta/citryl-CoA lyase
MVRMNPLDSPWGARDLELTMRAPPDAYVVPKVRSAADVHEIDAILSRLEKEYGHEPGAVRLVLIATETPLGLLNIAELGGCPRVEALTWGAEDLSAAIGAARNRGDDGRYLEIFRFARHMTLLAACAAEVQPIDGVWVDVRDLDGLRAETREAAQMGFTGKITIHPSQVDVVNEVLTPTPSEIEESRELVAEFQKHEQAGIMAFRFRGLMVDAPHLTRAKSIMERARLAGLT